MRHNPDITIEPIRGLPGTLPEGEEILWQGRPNGWALSWQSLNLPWVMGYFVVLGVWRAVAVSDQVPVLTAAAQAIPFLLLGVAGCAILALIGYIQARATVYTITNKRVVMRIGAALTLTLNIPFSKMANAHLAMGRRGTGTIAFELLGETKLSFLVCWPHARPWRLRKPEPAMRAIPDAQAVARLLAEAAEAAVSEPSIVATEANAARPVSASPVSASPVPPTALAAE
ncbi:MAG: photosynthetic complex putative assembly protein PuhB [Pseudomonadota bacterium]